MPLNLSNRDQNSGHLFYNRRLRAAITRFSVRMKHDDRKQQAALALGMVFVLIGVGWMALLHVLKPAGLVGRPASSGTAGPGRSTRVSTGGCIPRSTSPRRGWPPAARRRPPGSAPRKSPATRPAR